MRLFSNPASSTPSSLPLKPTAWLRSFQNQVWQTWSGAPLEEDGENLEEKEDENINGCFVDSLDFNENNEYMTAISKVQEVKGSIRLWIQWQNGHVIDTPISKTIIMAMTKRCDYCFCPNGRSYGETWWGDQGKGERNAFTFLSCGLSIISEIFS